MSTNDTTQTVVDPVIADTTDIKPEVLKALEAEAAQENLDHTDDVSDVDNVPTAESAAPEVSSTEPTEDATPAAKAPLISRISKPTPVGIKRTASAGVRASASMGNAESNEQSPQNNSQDRPSRFDRNGRGGRMDRNGNGRGMNGRDNRDGRGDRSGRMMDRDDRDRDEDRSNDTALQEISGYLDLTADGHAVVRRALSQSRNDAYLSISVVRKLNLRPGDFVTGTAREPRENDRYWGMKDISTANGKTLDQLRHRRRFEDMVPVYPDEKIVLETGTEPISTRLIDLVAPIGKGQRGLIVSPPKAGKTSVMKEMATGIAKNYPDVHLMAVLIGERPEEVTDIARHIAAITNGTGETAASNFDEQAMEQTRVAEVALERAKRLVEEGRDVVILLDSITRLARAYNLAIPTSGRTLSGGFDPAALYPPKRFFGAARNFEEAGSLTIIGTALIDTGSRMDDLVYEEFKGTGNMELHLDRKLAERRIYPAINVQRSGTRRDDLLFSNAEYQSIIVMHRMMDMLNEDERSSMVIRRLKDTKDNKQFLASLKEG